MLRGYIKVRIQRTFLFCPTASSNNGYVPKGGFILDAKGAGMTDLSYVEPSEISEYFLQRTFKASLVSYRFLMFLTLFYNTARAPGRPIASICDKIFDGHRAPPRGAAEESAQQIRNICAVDSFPDFFKAMGLTTMTLTDKAQFCSFLKRSIGERVTACYYSSPIL